MHILKKIGDAFIFLIFSILIILFIGVASATTTQSFYVTSALDKTNGSQILSSSDLAKLNASDDSRYTSKAAWTNTAFADTEFIDFRFSPGVTCGIISDVTLTFEWQLDNNAANAAGARLVIYNSVNGTSVINLSIPPANTDVTTVHNLTSFLNSEEDINSLRVRFQAIKKTSSAPKSKHDFIQLTVTCSDSDGNGNGEQDTTPPMCSVDFAKHQVSSNQYDLNVSMSYIRESGKYLIFGRASDSESNIFNIQYNRTSLPSTGQNHGFTNADPVDVGFNEPDEDWKSKPTNDIYEDGIHTVCCKALDSANNPSEASCQTFCIDTQRPDKPAVKVGNVFDCAEGFTNENPVFSWQEINSNGCSPIEQFDVQINDSGSINQIETELLSLELTGVNGHSYSIRVRAVDKAGNIGDFSDWSDVVVFDDENPEVEITGPDASEWISEDFEVSEVDTDNLGLFKCEYKVNIVNGSTTVDWTETECNKNVTIKVPEECNVDGINICRVSKRTTDKACNVKTSSKLFDIDANPPTTIKTVSEPKYPGFQWISWLIDWFVRDNTEIAFECEDAGIGCNSTFYEITLPNGNSSGLIEYDGPFSLEEGDGVYLIEYFSVDLLGQIEETRNETDKVDTMPPESVKTEEPLFVDDGIRWVGLMTMFEINASDDEVGVNETRFAIIVDDEDIFEEQYERPFSLGHICEDSEDASIPVTIEYSSVDHLGNEEETKNQSVVLDCRMPSLTLLNPTEEEAGNIEKCVQSIVALVNDNESGVKRVWAELNDSNGLVRQEDMLFTGVYGTYEALMDKQLPAGGYILTVYAEDNAGNVEAISMQETLSEGIFVEFIDPAICSINAAQGGQCDFTFNICMRGGDSVKFWLDKLGDVITPAMMNASISKGANNAFVGLMKDDESLTDAGLLELDEEIINGRTDFDLHLKIPADVASQIGAGSHKLDYLIKALAR